MGSPYPMAYDNNDGRIRGRRLQRIRAQHFALHPLCVHCTKAGRTRPATQLDHIVALSNGGPDFDKDEGKNRQGLCDDCHVRKTDADMGYAERLAFDRGGRVRW